MPIVSTNSALPSNLYPYALSTDEIGAIGRLVRATAEIEYLISLYLCQIAKIGEGQAMILLGKTQPSARLKLAEQFAIVRGGDALAVHKECFDNEHYYGIVRCRNTVVHGLLLGKTDEGNIAFMVQEPAGAEENRYYSTVRAYEPRAFEDAARVAEGVIPQLIARLSLQPLLDKRRTQSLTPHPKAPRPQTQRAKRERPPQPSSQ